MQKLISFFVKFPIWTNVLIVIVVLIGLASAFNLKKSFFPENRVKDIFVEVTDPGTSPQEMEEGITLKIEDALKGIAGIERVTSTTTENYTNIHIVTLRGYDAEEVLADVKNAVDQISSFPENAEKPKVYKRKPTDRAIYINLHGNLDLIDLKTEAEKVEDDFLASGLISQINIVGLPDLEISIEVDEQTLLRHSITMNQVIESVRSSNLDISAGSIKGKKEEILIRSRNRSSNPHDFENIVVGSKDNGSVLLLKEIASIELQFAETPNKTTFNGEPSVAINVDKLPEEDVIKITDWVKDYIKQYNSENALTQIDITRDRSIGLNQRIDLLSKNGKVGFILVLVVLGIFMNFRLSFWVSFGIPISFLGMIIIANMAGVTVNQISLFGMILVIGILVDDGIVISENIFTYQEKGMHPAKAAIKGTLEVLPSVFTSVMTTIMAFCAFFFLDGNIGEFMMEMAIVVIACLGFSLIEATLILPAHLNHKKLKDKEKSGVRLMLDDNLKWINSKIGFRKYLNRGIDYLRFNLYGSALKFLLKWRFATIAIPFAFIIVVVGMIGGGLIPMSFFPHIDSNNISIEIELEPGTREQATEDILAGMEAKVWKLNQELVAERGDSQQVVVSCRMTIGRSAFGAGGHTGKLQLRLLNGEFRLKSSKEISARLKAALGEVNAARNMMIGSYTFFGKPISIILTSKNSEELDQATNELKVGLKSYTSLKDVVDDNAQGKRELELKLKPKAFYLGLDARTIMTQVRQAFFGSEAQRIQLGADELKVWVRYPETDRLRIDQMENMRIKVGQNQYPLSELVDLDIQRSPVAIKHYNGARQVKVEASLVNAKDPAAEINTKVEETLLAEILDKYPSVKLQMDGQKLEQSKLQKSAKPVFSILLVLIILIITLTFRSKLQPFLVIFMIPFGVVGAILGHFIEDTNLVIMSYFGMLALSGVIINDAVVFMEKYNQNLRKGMKVWESVYDAGINRFRPIVLTSITTIAGLYPLIFEQSTQAQFLIPMAITVAYGVLFGTVIILFFFPVILLLTNDLRVMWAYLNRRLRYALLYAYDGKPESGKMGVTREEVEPAVREAIRLGTLGSTKEEEEKTEKDIE